MTLPKTMRAMVTMGHGGMDQMVLHTDWPVPVPAAGEVLVKVKACGMNNTDVNTRVFQSRDRRHHQRWLRDRR